MPTQIKCPTCSNSFDIEDVLSSELEQKYQSQFQEKLNASLKLMEADKQRLLDDQKAFEEKKKKENELFAQKLQQEKQKITQELQASIQASLQDTYENKLKLLERTNEENRKKITEAQQKELDFLQKVEEFKTREAELELNTKRKINEEREKLSIEIREIEKQKLEQIENEFKLRLAEKEKQLEDQKKLAEEAVRKAQQGSMQLQGEVQELMLEDILRSTFPYDKISPVGKGVKGADCIHTVCNPYGQECGKIIYESKRTKDFANDWIEKLKADMRALGADVAVIVTQALPKDMDRFGEKDGVYICTFAEVRSMTSILRNTIIRVFQITSSQEGKGDKMTLLYDYLTGNEFGEQWKAIREGFLNMKMSITRERDAMEKLWKSREKQLELVLLNATRIHGSIEGIAGKDVNLNLLDDTHEALVLE